MTDLSELKCLIGIPAYREDEYNIPHYLTSKTQLIMPLDVGSYPNVKVNPVGNAGAQGLPFATPQRLSPETWQGEMPFNCAYPRPEEIAYICGLAMSQGCAGGKHGFSPGDAVTRSLGSIVSGGGDYYVHSFTTKDNNDLRLWSSSPTVIYEEPPASFDSGNLGLVERHNGLIINDFSFGTEIGDSMVASLQANGFVSGSYSELEVESGASPADYKHLDVSALASPDDAFNGKYYDVDPTVRSFISGQALTGQNMGVYLVRRTRSEIAAGDNETFAVADAESANRNTGLLFGIAKSDFPAAHNRLDITKLLFSFRLTFNCNFNQSTNREFGTGALARGHRGNPFYTIGLELNFRRNRSLDGDVRKLIQSAKDGDQWGIQIPMVTETLSATQGKGVLWTFPCMQISEPSRVTVNNELANRVMMEPVFLSNSIKPMYLDVIDDVTEWHESLVGLSSATAAKFEGTTSAPIAAPAFTSK